jgi:hypothetical protein
MRDTPSIIALELRSISWTQRLYQLHWVSNAASIRIRTQLVSPFTGTFSNQRCGMRVFGQSGIRDCKTKMGAVVIVAGVISGVFGEWLVFQGASLQKEVLFDSVRLFFGGFFFMYWVVQEITSL